MRLVLAVVALCLAVHTVSSASSSSRDDDSRGHSVSRYSHRYTGHSTPSYPRTYRYQSDTRKQSAYGRSPRPTTYKPYSYTHHPRPYQYKPTSLVPPPYKPSPYKPSLYKSSPYRPSPYRPSPYKPSPYKPSPYKSSPYKPIPYKPTPYRPSLYKPSPYKPAPYKLYKASKPYWYGRTSRGRPVIGVTKEGRPITAESQRRTRRPSYTRVRDSYSYHSNSRDSSASSRTTRFGGQLRVNRHSAASRGESSLSDSHSSDADHSEEEWRQIFRMGGKKLALIPGSGSSSSDVSFGDSSQSDETWTNIFKFRRGRITLFSGSDERNPHVYRIGGGRMVLGTSRSKSSSSSRYVSDDRSRFRG